MGVGSLATWAWDTPSCQTWEIGMYLILFDFKHLKCRLKTRTGWGAMGSWVISLVSSPRSSSVSKVNVRIGGSSLSMKSWWHTAQGESSPDLHICDRYLDWATCCRTEPRYMIMVGSCADDLDSSVTVISGSSESQIGEQALAPEPSPLS